jgi:hypothetical protein
MAVTFAVGLRACCVAVGLLLVSARAAEPVSPLMGVTRDQLLSRFGEPKSQMEVGNRLIFFYPREKIVLRDGVVVEVEQFASETPAPAAAPPTQSETPAPAKPAAPAVQTPAAPESKVEIKSVRSPSAKDGRVATVDEPRATPTPAPVAPAPAPPPKKTPVVSDAAKNAALAAEKKATSTSAVDRKTPPPKAESISETKASDDLTAKKKKEAAPAPTPVSTAPASPPAAAPAPAEGILGNRTYVIGLAVLLGGAALLFWKYRQRQMELAASSVENTPVSSTNTPVFSGNGFSADVLNKLEWKRFEELVTAYYNKTGVVATRTKSGPTSPVHIKISWKGEPRPFAYVQCIAQPAAVIDPRPLQALVAALAADDIRRGYVVTTGKFNVVARDFADEKHLTLLSGDTLLEKLNAMPAAARTEIMQGVSAGDYTVPSCPKCEAKMAQSTDTPPVWRCPNHPAESMPVRS